MDNLFIEKLNNLLSRVSLIDILRDKYKVVPRGGNNYTVQCPFHLTKKRSRVGSSHRSGGPSGYGGAYVA